MTDSLTSTAIITDSCTLDSTLTAKDSLLQDSMPTPSVFHGLDSILFERDSSSLMRTEAYQLGVKMPDRTYAMTSKNYSLAGDDIVVGMLGILFCLLAGVLYKSRENIIDRLKDFFSTQRTYGESHTGDNAGEAVSVLILITISVLSLTCIFLHRDVTHSSLLSATGMPYWLLGAGFVVGVGFVYIKAWIYSLVNWTFFSAESNKRWLMDYLFLTSLTSFAFYPIALVDIFFVPLSEIVTGSVILTLVIYEILLFYKLIINFKIRKYGYVLIFLYFCSVELMPALVLQYLMQWLNYNYLLNNILY